MDPPELEDEGEVDPEGSCGKPGRFGCHHCEACAAWGDEEYERKRDKEMEEQDAKAAAEIRDPPGNPNGPMPELRGADLFRPAAKGPIEEDAPQP